MQERGRAKLNLYGPFGLIAPSGVRVEVKSKKGAALIAMLALSSEGERTRSWLQDRLWGSRERAQAQNSLRRELSHLRSVLDAGGVPILRTGSGRVSLTLAHVEIVARKPGQDLLEGFDIPGEDGFEDWLRDQRQASSAVLASAPAVPALPLPLSLPAAFHRTASIAILPFTNLTGDPDKAYLAEGIGDELLDRVSRLRWLPVISPGQSFIADDTESSLDVGRRLGAAYVLSGKLRIADGEYWLSGQITDCASGVLVWSPRLRLPAPHASNAMVPFVNELVAALENRLGDVEQGRARALPGTDLGVNDLIWRGRWHLHRLSRQDSDAAIACLENALALDPRSSEALIQLATAKLYNVWAERGTSDGIAELRKLAQQAMLADNKDGRGYTVAAIVEMWMRRPERAEKLFDQAVALNPSLFMAWSHIGGMNNLRGRPADALAPLHQALKLSPHDEQVFYVSAEIAIANLFLGDWQKAIDHAERAIVLRPAYWYAHVIRINALARSGQLAEARAAQAELMSAKPRFTPAYIDWLPYTETAPADFLKFGLQRLDAGQPTSV